jgi:hypothetical protein
MRSRSSGFVAAALAAAIALAAPIVATGADDREVESLLAQADGQSSKAAPAPSKNPTNSAPRGPARTAEPVRMLDDRPRPRDTMLAVGGGLLVVVLAGLGLTITFRSLRADLRGRKHRYRRRIRREPRSA